MGNIFREALRRTFEIRFWKKIFPSIGSSLAILNFAGRFFFSPNAPIQEVVIWTIWQSCFFALIRLVYFYITVYFVDWRDRYAQSYLLNHLNLLALKDTTSTSPTNIYGEAIIFLNSAFTVVHWLRKKKKITLSDLHITMTHFCENLKEIFDKKTGSKCAVTLKLVKGPHFNTNAEVRNLARNSSANIRETPEYSAKPHFVFANTRFNEILGQLFQNQDRLELFYLLNDIPRAIEEGHYNSTTIKCPYNKTLRYVSEMVVPLYPMYSETSSNFKILGFLCVDSDKLNVFDRVYDIPILQGAADGIYDIIHKCKMELEK